MRIVFRVLVVAFLVSGGTLCQADVVVWSSTAYTVNGSFGQNLDTGIFDQSGTLILANNTGGDALTFDGINFAAGTNVFSGTYGGFHESGGSQNTDLARFGTHGTSGPDMVALSGLTIGMDIGSRYLFMMDGVTPESLGGLSRPTVSTWGNTPMASRM